MSAVLIQVAICTNAVGDFLVDNYIDLVYNYITDTCKTTTHYAVKEVILWQNKY